MWHWTPLCGLWGKISYINSWTFPVLTAKIIRASGKFSLVTFKIVDTVINLALALLCFLSDLLPAFKRANHSQTRRDARVSLPNDDVTNDDVTKLFDILVLVAMHYGKAFIPPLGFNLLCAFHATTRSNDIRPTARAGHVDLNFHCMTVMPRVLFVECRLTLSQE